MNHTETNDTDARVVHIGPYAYWDFLERANRFHGYPAPGIIVGGFMVAEAIQHMAEDVLFDAISETAWCLPDAVQILTPCTAGNGWLKILDLGIFAVSLYDKTNGLGVRTSLDVQKVSRFKEIAAWLLKLKPKKEQDADLLSRQIREAGASICSIEKIQVSDAFRKKRSKGEVGPCPGCGAIYPLKQGRKCRLCQGESPYILRNAASESPSRD